MMTDLRYAFRQLLKHPGFTAVAVLTLAVGIGANTAMFSFVNAILLRPLPYSEGEQLVMVFENHLINGWRKAAIGAPILGEWRRQTTVFEGLAARGGGDFILTGKGQPEYVSGSRLSANAFSLLRVKPLLGRDFLPEEETYGKHYVVLLSYELWMGRFGADPKIIGQSVLVNSEPHTVIGVMPPGILFPKQGVQVWTPLAFSPKRLQQRHAHNYMVYGRLKPGVTLAHANAEMQTIARRMELADSENKGWGAEVHSLREILVGDSRRMLLVLLGSVGFVLLIGCVNIANLLLARAASRRREFAIRSALGASRAQMIRQLLIESLLLATLGGVGGAFLASMATPLLAHWSPADLPRLGEGVRIDATALGFTAMVTLVTGLGFGLAPALQSTKRSLTEDLNENPRGASAGLQKRQLQAGLVVSEVALSVVLLVGAGLMLRSFNRLLAQPLGFQPEHVVSMALGLPITKYPDLQDRVRFFDQLSSRVRTIPGVQSAGLVLGLPLVENQNSIAVWIPDAAPPAPGESVAAGYAQVSPGYFRTMNIPFVKGRDFTDEDRSNTTPALVVDETFVKNFKLGTNTLGRRVRVGDDLEQAEIIGVVKDTKREGLAEPPRGEMYRTYRQISWGAMHLVVRTQRDPADITRAVRAELDAIDKDQPLEHIRTMTQLVSVSVARQRLSVQLLGGFSAMAMVLAAIGLYGVLAYNVSQRTREVGIRLALGAQKRDVLALIVGQGVKLALIGVGVGAAGALLLTQLIKRLLFETKPTDPLTFAAVVALLTAVAFVASWFPARHAARLDPMEALRWE